MSGSDGAILIVLVLGILAAAAVMERRRNKGLSPRYPKPEDGPMVKAIKITMGICIGLALAAVLLSFGYLAILSTMFAK